MPPEEMTSSTSFVVDRYWHLHTIDNPYNRLLKAAIMKETTPKNGVDTKKWSWFGFYLQVPIQNILIPGSGLPETRSQ